MSRTPDFLIVGAMKAGTTTLYRDLQSHLDIFLPQQKEPETLVRLQNAAAIRSEYRAMFGSADATALCGEASTAYTKRPQFEGVAARAKTICGGDLKVIYLRRDPLERILSHYRHEMQHGRITDSFSAALREHDELIDFTRYDWQIAPWRNTFGEENILEIQLEDYAAARAATVAKILSFLGLDLQRLGTIDAGRIANRAGDTKTVSNPLLRALLYSNLYQKRLKGCIPATLREKARKSLLPRPKLAEAAVNEDDRAYISARLASSPPAAAH